MALAREVAVMIPGLFIILTFCGSSGRSLDFGQITETVDLIELNHFYDRQGRHIYDQVIFYERLAGNGEYRVRAWCLVEDRESLNRRPQWIASNDMYQVDWLDSDHGVLRTIRSRLYRESWSHVDPERQDKKHLEERYRLALIKPSKERNLERHEEKSRKLAAFSSLPSTTVDPKTQIAMDKDAVVAKR
jgi:hypothetical protein